MPMRRCFRPNDRRLITGLGLGLMMVVATACGSDNTKGSSSAADLRAFSAETYLNSLVSKANMASSYEALALRSAVVAKGALVSVADGQSRVYEDGDSVHTARFTFVTGKGDTSYVLDLPRPTNITPDSIAKLFPAGTQAVLYLGPYPFDVGEREQTKNIPAGTRWQLTTPQGLIFDIPGIGIVQPEHTIGITPRTADGLDAYMPADGAKLG